MTGERRIAVRRAWELWHGIQQVLIADYGSDRRAAHRTQVLRLPGTLHLKDPAHPHLVQIVEDLTSPKSRRRSRRAPLRSWQRDSAIRVQPAGQGIEPGAEWAPRSILAAFRSIDARLQETGPSIARRIGPKWRLVSAACPRPETASRPAGPRTRVGEPASSGHRPPVVFPDSGNAS